MNKIEFLDKKVRKYFETIISEERSIEYVLNDIQDKYENIMIYDIMNNNENIQIVINTEKGNITLIFEKRKNMINLVSPKWDYCIIYSSIVRKDFSPLGKKYEKNSRSILVLCPLNNTIYRYKFAIDSFMYEISISRENMIFDEKKLINLLLNIPEFKGIIDIYEIIKHVVSYNDIYLKIKRNDDIDCGSMLIYSDGNISKYVEYFNNGYLKLYYENGKIKEEVTKEIPVEEEYTGYVKRIGEKNG